MKFGENLYHLRKLSKMSQETLAEEVGVSRQSVSKWEKGDAYPEMDNILKLCKIFHCKINDLVHEDLTDIDSLDEEIKMSVVKFEKEKQERMKGLSKAIYIIARIGKVVVTIAIPVVVILLMFFPYIIKNVDVVDNKIVFKGENSNVKIVEENIDNDISIKMKFNDSLIADESDPTTIAKIKEVLDNNSKTKVIAYVELGMLCLILCLILYRMTLNRLEKLFVNINNGDTPFTLENVKYIKEMANLMIFSIVLPNCGGLIFERILRTDLDVGFEIFDIVQILFLFSMAYIFEYGYELQLDSKGKIYGEVDENE